MISVKTEKDWINEIADIPIFGGIFLFLLVFIPPVVASFLIQTFIPALHNDDGFTKAMLLLLPGWNTVLWFTRIKLFIFFIPTWILFGVIAIIKGIEMF